MSTHVVVLGAGYAGMAAAKRLARENIAVTVVNPRAEFVERIRLHQYVAGNHPAVQPLSEVLSPRTELLVGVAQSIDAGQRSVRLGDGSELDYDYLIYAVGSGNREAVIPGANDHAVGLDTWEGAVNTRKRLLQLPSGATVSVVGGGLSGIETAAELAGLGGFTVRLVTAGQIGTSLSEPGRAKVRAFLADAGVETVEQAAVIDIRADKLELTDGCVLDSDLTIVTTTIGVPDLAVRSGLRTDARGALLVDERLVSASSPAIIGAGDSVRLPQPVRMSCQAAIPSGIHAAQTVLALRDGRHPKPIRRKFVSQAASLGRHDALIQLGTLDDTPTRLAVTGRVAALVKEAICRGSLTFGKVGPLHYSWTWRPGN
ncbi:NAD(P)/FAD-dependent oxidoreductase [Nocardia tengchongensis]|uniref:NAD(P)/FAD-dependent oxidoreductase n=1 Tax=Nocardia tengchongensis TaxID=2055889 RepID=UPI003698CD2D